MVRRDAIAPLLPAVGVLVTWIAWIPFDGGFAPGAWYPAAIFSVGLLAVSVVAGRAGSLGWTEANLALAGLVGLVAWCFLSILWAGSRSSAVEAADQLMLYVAMAWVIALVRWRVGSAMAFLGIWALATGLACVGFLIASLGTSDIPHYVFEKRWQQPTGYANSAAALASMACFPAIAVATTRRMPRLLQVACMVLATFLIDFSLLPQSRAQLLVIVLVLPLFVVLAADRGRLLARLAVIGVAVSVAVGPAFGVFDAADAGRSIPAAIHHAARWLILSAAIAAACGALLVAIEARYPASERVRRAASRAGRVAVASALVVGLVLVAVNAGRIGHYASERWSKFKSPTGIADEHQSLRIAKQSSDKRYDYWRVAVLTFRASPVAGAGAGNFEYEYTPRRHHAKHSRSAHDIWLRTLSETGLVGAILLFGSLIAGLAGLMRTRRSLDAERRLLIAGSVAVSAYFLGHASFDWLELMPALAAPAVALPFLALRLSRPAATDSSHGARTRRWSLAAAPVAVVAGVALVAPYLSSEYVKSSLAAAREDPHAAIRDARLAAELNPFAPEPYYAKAVVAMNERRDRAAEKALRSALSIESSWYPHFELALLAAHEGRFAAARREVAAARTLDPLDPIVLAAARLIHARRRLDAVAFNRRVLEQPLYRGQHSQ